MNERTWLGFEKAHLLQRFTFSGCQLLVVTEFQILINIKKKNKKNKPNNLCLYPDPLYCRVSGFTMVPVGV